MLGVVQEILDPRERVTSDVLVPQGFARKRRNECAISWHRGYCQLLGLIRRGPLAGI